MVERDGEGVGIGAGPRRRNIVATKGGMVLTTWSGEVLAGETPGARRGRVGASVFFPLP